MLDLMRRQSYLIYLVFGGIIFIFAVNFGPGSSGCSRGSQQAWAAKVDGEPIRQHEFAMLYSQQMDYMRRMAQRTGQEFDPSRIDGMLRAQILDELVERKLLAKEAQSRGLLISDDELAEFLREHYGVKDVTEDVYENWVTRTFDTSVYRFEEDARSDIAARRMAQLLSDSLTVGDDELKQTYERTHDRAKIRYVRFEIDTTKAPAPAASEIDKLLQDEMPAVSLQYNKDVMLYRTAEQVHLLQIVRTLPATASDAAVAEARNILLDVAEKLGKGGDFAALARQYSQDTATQAKGGDLGWVQQGEIARPLQDASFALPAGSLTQQPVRSPAGLHLLKVVEKKEAQRRELDSVKREVAISVLKERSAEALAKSASQGLLAALKAGKKWDDMTVDEDVAHTSALKAARLARQESPWISRAQEAIPRIGLAKELKAEIFTLTAAAPLVRQPYKVNGSYYVVGLTEREMPDMQKFATEKETLREGALLTKRKRVLHDWLTYLRNQAKVQKNPALLSSTEAGG